MQKQNQNVCPHWNRLYDRLRDRQRTIKNEKREGANENNVSLKPASLTKWMGFDCLLSWQGTHKSHNWIFKAVKNEKRGLVSTERNLGRTTLNALIRSDEGLTLETSASESLYGGQLTLTTQLIKPDYLVKNERLVKTYICRSILP